MKINIKLVSFLGLGIFLCVLVGAWFLTHEAKQQVSDKGQEVSQKEQAIRSTDRLIDESNFKGTALIIKDGQITYERGYGEANEQTNTANQPDTVFPIASLQKSISAALILRLVEEQKLRLDESIHRFYPEIDGSESITIEQLLNHTSGIYMDEIAPAEVLTSQERQLAYTLDTLAVYPTNNFQYTNANYTLLAGIVSMLNQEPYETVVEKQVITPLELKHTYFWDTLPTSLSVPIAYTYSGKNSQENPTPPTEALYSSLLGAGNMFMSIGDFWAFIQSLSNGKLFQQETYNQLAGINNGGYCSGMVYLDDLFYSEGSLDGFNTIIYGDQTKQNAVLLFANQAPTDAIQTLSQEIYDAWLF